MALAAVPVAAAPTGTVRPRSACREIDKTLSSDAFEGRGPATRAETKTVNYIADQFKAAGASAGRRHRRRQAQLDAGGAAAPVGVRRHAAAQRSTSAMARRCADPGRGDRRPRADSTATRRSTSPTRRCVFVGYGVEAPERNWDDFKGQDLRGKILVVLVNDPDFEGGEGDFGGKAMTYYGRWTYKYEEAARRGAAGVLVIHETDAGLLRLGDGQELQHQRHVRHRPQESRGRAPAARRLDPARPRRADLSQRRASTSTRRRPPPSARTSSRSRSRRRSTCHGQAKTEVITSHNVVGYLPGKKYPDETVIYTAPLGSSRHRPSRRHRRHASTMARSTTAPASPS